MQERSDSIPDPILSFSFRLLVRHPTMYPGEISAGLGMSPRLAQVVGAPRQTPTGMPLPGRYAATVWSTWCDIQTGGRFYESASSKIEVLAESADFIKNLKATGGSIQIIFDLSGQANFGDTVSAEDLAMLGALGLDLGFEVFPDGTAA